MDGSPVSIKYGKIRLMGTIVKFRGHEMYDVCYTIDGKVEPGVNIDRLIPVNVAFRLKSYGEFELPVLTVPLRHRNKALGVLCVDTMGAIPHAPFETVPVYGLVRFTEQIGRLLGATLDLYPKKVYNFF